MILITGATGQFGKLTIDFLLQKGVQPSEILALVRTEAAGNSFQARGIGVRVADYGDKDSLLRAFQGVTKLLFVSSSDLANRLQQHKNVVEAAAEIGINHVIYTSFQRKNDSENSPLWQVAESHLATENWIKASGLNYTILKNNLYLDFVPGFIGEKVLETGVIYLPAGTGKLSAVLRSDMAEAAAILLKLDAHTAKEFNFSNETAVSYEEIAAELSQLSGKSINFVSPTVEEYQTTLSSYGVPAEVVSIFAAFAAAQAQGELDAVSTDLSNILGRKPVSILDFVRRVYAS
ncbi:SDR family oxidoreductase [Flavobacterium sp.]|uniref:SDR family oxidoreductase n=1 Tax=Flavobacterium sp. TaxID=239 RepID=UPI00261763D2|nr:SDR family oxidoreductase [Flavobacterium sp.]